MIYHDCVNNYTDLLKIRNPQNFDKVFVLEELVLYIYENEKWDKCFAKCVLD